MKTKNKRARKLMRANKRAPVNRWPHQPIILSPVFILVLAKLGFNQLRSPQKLLGRLQLHIAKLTGNAWFPVTEPSLSAIQTLADELEKTIQKIEAGDKSFIPHRQTLVMEAENAIRKLSYDIQNLSNGNEEMIKSAGFAVRQGKGATKPVGEVMQITAEPIGPGKVILHWKKIAYSRMNFIEITDNPVTGTWKPLDKTGKSSFIVTGLTPGALYYFRVYGSNSLGDSNPSESAEQRSL